MKDKDQHLLWEAYVAEQKSVAGRTPPKDKLNKGDFLPKKVRDEINDEEDEGKDEVEESSELTDEQKEKGKKSQFKQMKDDLDEEENEDVQEEEMELAHRSPEEMMKKELTEVLVQHIEMFTDMAPPEDLDIASQHRFSIDKQLSDAKDFIRSVLDDIGVNQVSKLMKFKQYQDSLPVQPETGVDRGL